MYLVTIGSVIKGLLQWFTPIEFVTCMVLLIVALVAVFLIVKDVLKELFHPSHSSEVFNDDSEQ